MCGMHFHFVCNMNKFGRVLFIYILFVVATGAADIKSKQSSTTSTSKEPSTTNYWKTPSTTRWKQPSSTTTWKEPSSTIAKKEATTTRWKYLTTTTSWKQPATTTSWKQPTTTKATPTTRISSHAAANHGVVAVASISGIDARNGRYSSMNGIKIFPSGGSSVVKTDDKGNFIFKSVDGKTPITITKQGDGVSGTIRILPGSVSVSSSASSSSKSGPTSAVASFNPWSSSYMKPMMNDIYFPPFPTFPSIPDYDSRIPDTSFQARFPDPFPLMRFPDPTYHKRIQDPWVNKASFRSSPPKQDIFKPSWYFATFNPFIHFW